MPGRHFELIRPFDFEPGLLDHLPQRDAEAARRYTVVDSVWLDEGEIEPPAIHADSIDVGFLVSEGLLLHCVDHVGRRAIELLGPGDLIRPWRPGDQAASLPSHVSWLIVEPARLALLDHRFVKEIARWPGVLSAVLDRLNHRMVSLALQLALAKLPRLDLRLLCLFWHLADRWGRTERDGVTVSIRLSHQTLAELVSARRPSVTHTLGDLSDDGRLVRISSSCWLLRGQPPATDGAHLFPRDVVGTVAEREQ